MGGKNKGRNTEGERWNDFRRKRLKKRERERSVVVKRKVCVRELEEYLCCCCMEFYLLKETSLCFSVFF